MSNEGELRGAILAAAFTTQKVDLSNPANAFTIWHMAGWEAAASLPVLCDNAANFNDARVLARTLRELKSLVILSADPKQGLFSVPDNDREEFHTRR